jgi:hypothetical protein
LPFDEATFIADLASCRAVVATAGFTLMSEAISLDKPMLAVPIRGQFEQVLNARYLEREGYGATADDLNEEVLRGFIAKQPWFEERLASYRHDGNAALFGALDARLGRVDVDAWRRHPADGRGSTPTSLRAQPPLAA